MTGPALSQPQTKPLFFHFIFGVDDVVVLLGARARPCPRAGTGCGAAVGGGFGARLGVATGRAAWSGLGLVHLLGELVARFSQKLHLLLDDVAVVGFERIAQL